MRRHLIAATGLVGATLLLVALPPSANSLTTKECSAKYSAAKSAGTTKGMTWNAFRKAECGPNAAATEQKSDSGSTAAEKKETKATKTEAKTETKTTKSAPSAATAPGAPAGDAVFPNAVAAKYASETAGKARMHTCLDQYNANKATNSNGGLKWIQKGGGYYSECNKRLKA